MAAKSHLREQTPGALQRTSSASTAKIMNVNSALKWSIQPKSITLWLATANLSFNLFEALTIQGTGVAEAWYIRWDPMNLPTCLWLAALMLRIGNRFSLFVSSFISGTIFFYWGYRYISFYSAGDLAYKIAVLFQLFDALLHFLQLVLAAIILLLSTLELRKKIVFLGAIFHRSGRSTA